MIHNISRFIAALALLATAQGVWADTETVSYVDADGNAQTPVEANLITSSNDLTLLYSGWYVVKENTTCSTVRLMTQQTTNIILCDGATLSVTSLDGNNTDQSLVLWGQTQGTGTLDFEEIRGDIVTSVTVNSGKLICSSVMNGNSYAIGGKNCTLTVNGGEVRLASGLFGSVMGNVVFNGGVLDCAKVKGNVTLNNSRSTDHVKISEFGGTVTVALPDGYAYTDGSGNYYANGTLTDAQKSAIAGKTLNVAPDPAHFSQSGDEYTIHTATGWGVFCDCLNDNDTYNRFSGKTVRLGADIEVSRMAGSQYHDFCGTFDGGGNTLTVTLSGSSDRMAPFSYISNENNVAAAIRNLNVVADINSSGQNASALVGEAWGELTIEKCTVSGTVAVSKQFAGGIIGSASNTPLNISNCISSVTIRSSVSGDGTHGGFAGRVPSSATLNISGCVFDGKIITTSGTNDCGGFVGHSEHAQGSNVSITDCLYAPAALADGETEVQPGDGETPGATFCRNIADGRITNCYYTRALGTAQGKAPRTVTAAADVTIDAVALTGTATQYTVSGITAYANGGLQRGQTLYYGSGDQLSLTLSNTAPAAPLGYQYAYTASAGTLSGTTLTMPDQDVTISTALAAIDWATVNLGTIGNPYMIYNKDQLLLLAHRVNGTNGETANGYEGKYFKLGADITFDHDADEGDNYAENYEAIGTYIGGTYSNFKGNFDGDGHTVSGIRIRKTGSYDANSYQGLFGFIDSSADIHDVHLTDARITGYEKVGGIAGYNYGTVSGCSVTDSYITATDNWNYGTICGWNGGTLTNNYYHGCTVDDTPVTAGVGCKGADIADYNGALPAYRLVLGENITTPPGTFAGQDGWLATPPVDARLAPENGFTLAGNHYFASGYKFTPGSTLASGAAQGYTPRATLGGQLLDPYTPTGEADQLAGKAIAQFTVSADCDGKTLASTQAIYSTGQPVTVAYVNADGTPGETSAIALDGTETSLAAGTYFAGLENVNFDHKLTLAGDITLILKDGCTMNIGTSESRINGRGISGYSYTLDIYAQSLGDDMGALSVYNSGSYDNNIYVKALTVNGGNVTADAVGSGCYAINATTSNLTINGGNVTATSANSVAMASGANIYINGGTVNVTGSTQGISGSSLVEINGGTVNGTCTGSGYGIRATANVAINGGNVTASSIYANSGTITLGWSKPTDRITASSYSGTVQVADGKKLHNGSTFLYGTLSDPAADLNGKTLRPAANATYTTADGTTATADAILLDASDNSLPAGNYLATGTLNYTHGITLNGNVTLILADNCHMNVGTSGERIEDRGIFGYSPLTITSEANGTGNGNGALSIYTTGFNKCGILANAITIDGGNVTADTDGANAKALNAMSTDVTINGGTVTATTAGSNAHALLAYGNFNYNGGNVTATATNAEANAIYATGGNYTFSWRTPADRITIGATGLYAPEGKTATFARLFTDGSGHIYTGTLAASVLSGFPAETTLQPCLALADAASNTAAIADHAGQTLAVALTGRTLYKDGSWNTLCLPFSVTTASGTLSGDNVQAMTLDTSTSTFADGTLTLNFTAADETIPAGTPFIIKWDVPSDDYEPYTGQNAATCSDLVSPVFQGVTINAEKHDATVTDVLTFTGTYAPKEIGADGDNTVLYLGAANTLYYPTKSMTIGTHRAYFQLLGDLTAGEPTSPQPSHVRAFVLNFGDDEATGIISVHDSGFMVNASAAWYTLDGRRLDGQPTAKGLYIHGGRKLIVK